MGLRQLFGARPVMAMAVVEPQVSASYAQRARMTVMVSSPLAVALSCAAMAAAHVGLPGLLLGVPLGIVVGLVAGVTVLVWPVLRALWWWSVELLTLAGLLWVWVELSQVLAWWGAFSVLALTAVGLALVERVRRTAVALGWCVVDRHRLRLSFVRIVRGSSHGGVPVLPLMLWARPTPAGERVWVLLRPGLAMSDLEGKTDKLAVACWASEVRVARASARSAAFLRVDVARRDPLTQKVRSPLADRFAGKRQPAAPPESGLDGLALDLADVELPPVELKPRGGRR
ncbi:hypothetical protein ACPPVO_47140 [Dactylosporangium sp. McL0621]|uniref:hypothetical protein n=1 Tax=Dactylosporangium sp. McL0621 TaxID=3415678 RepID=UPI003CE7D063